MLIMSGVFDIGDRFKACRKKAGHSVPYIAKKLGIPKENLYKWEKGTKPSSMDDYRKLEQYIQNNCNNVPHETPIDNNHPPKKSLIGYDQEEVLRYRERISSILEDIDAEVKIAKAEIRASKAEIISLKEDLSKLKNLLNNKKTG